MNFEIGGAAAGLARAAAAECCAGGAVALPRYRATALMRGGSLFNHSCTPNSAPRHAPRDGRPALEFVALCSVLAGAAGRGG
jgi:hypothetical protein